MQNNFTAYSSLVERKPLAFKTEEAEKRRRLVQNQSEPVSVRKKWCDHRFTDAADKRKLALPKNIIDSTTYSSEYFRFLVWFMYYSRTENVSRAKTSPQKRLLHSKLLTLKASSQ
jgi:hypothetical protein